MENNTQEKMLTIVTMIILASLTYAIVNFVIVLPSIDELEERMDILEQRLDNTVIASNQKDVNYMYGTATAYHPPTGGINSDSDPTVTATGKPAEVGIIAVNPDVIPYGSQVMIIHEDTVIRGVAEDTGGAMKRNPTQVDILMGSLQECIDWGRRDVHIIWWEGE